VYISESDFQVPFIYPESSDSRAWILQETALTPSSYPFWRQDACIVMQHKALYRAWRRHLARTYKPLCNGTSSHLVFPITYGTCLTAKLLILPGYFQSVGLPWKRQLGGRKWCRTTRAGTWPLKATSYLHFLAAHVLFRLWIKIYITQDSGNGLWWVTCSGSPLTEKQQAGRENAELLLRAGRRSVEKWSAALQSRMMLSARSSPRTYRLKRNISARMCLA
jgi:hypothetical protein